MVVGSVSRGCQVVVIGGGPGGYVAAIRLAQLGKDVLLVERAPRLGGICLNEGCIPSKALIHAADLVHEAGHSQKMGVSFEGVSVDMPTMIGWKNGIVERLTGGVSHLCKKSGVEVMQGEATFVSDRRLSVSQEEGPVEVEFEQAVIATGSSPMELTGFPIDGETVIGPREALSLQEVPQRLVVIGAGYIGLELGTVYRKLGAKVTVVEFLPEIFPTMDPEVGKTLKRSLKKLGVKLHLSHQAMTFEPGSPATVITAHRDKDEALRIEADKVLVSIGRVANSKGLGLEETGVATDDKAFITVNDRMQTNVPGIYAIGDVVGGALLAHKAYQEAKVAAEVICGEPAVFDSVAIPAVVYTDPEIAVAGLGETEAREQGHEVVTGSFSFKASGRAMTLNATDGFIKVIADAETKQLLGVVAVGKGVSELMGEATLALEMGAFLEDIAFTIHPHPTMSEAVQEAMEAALGRAVHQ
ncbi:MAG: dihydrolipoyl dehydrogenase [Thermoanaerobaculales bacterium]|nr:dihydrolipoyl dehydrogenase [Thermoanaerobaculales bacterium]